MENRKLEALALPFPRSPQLHARTWIGSRTIGDSREIEAGALRIRSERSGTTHTLHLVGEFDLTAEDGFASEFDRAEGGDAEQIVIDLAQLEFMDSTGLRCLLAAASSTRANTPRVRVTRPQDQVKQLVELAGVGEHLPFVD